MTSLVRKKTQSIPGRDAGFTPRQGQFLAFIHYYTKLNGRPPAETDIARYFRITAPSAHQMVMTLERRGFIERVPGQQARRPDSLRPGRRKLAPRRGTLH